MKIALAAFVASASAGEWEDYKMFFGKVFNGPNADASHKATFDLNLAVIADQNAKNESLMFGLNQFTDLTQEEFKIAAGFGLRSIEEHVSSSPNLGEHIYQGESLPNSVDWQKRGAVTAVKNQGGCGSCWTFSVTGGLEGAWQLATGSLTSMSEQQFVDCNQANFGCSGGWIDKALSYAQGTAVATESSYGYTAKEGSCKSRFHAAIPHGGVSGHKMVGASLQHMTSAVAKGPVSVAIQADQSSFQQYSRGILSSGCGTRTDHAVLVVGYGTEHGTRYWRIKNSWGGQWGDHGYIRMSRANNVCGLLNNQAAYPIVVGSLSSAPDSELSSTSILI